MRRLESAAADPAARAVVMTGAGRAFCVESGSQGARGHARGRRPPLGTVVEHYNPVVRALATMPKPVIAAVRGMAAGAGASLAFLADFRIGGPRTAFLMAFANVGLAPPTPALRGPCPGWSAMPRRRRCSCSPNRCQPEAHRIGLLTRLVDDDEAVLPTAQELAARLAAGPTVAYGMIRRQLRQGTSWRSRGGAWVEKRRSSGRAGRPPTTAARRLAFVAKEKPTFTGA